MKKYLFTFILLLGFMPVHAQSLGSAYFLDNRYIYGYKVNPAFIPNDGTFSYMGLMINDLNSSLNTNVGLSNFVFPCDGKLVNGFNEKIKAEDFLDQLPDMSKASFNLSQGLLSLGSRTETGFLSIDLNLDIMADAFMPKSLFRVLKMGTANENAIINGLGLDLRSYLELAVNYAFRIGKRWKIGITAKGLLGLANGILDVQKFNAGSLHVNPLMLIQLQNSLVEFVPGGWGLAANVGANWDTPLDGLSVDLALMNLGGLLQPSAGKIGNFFELLPITVNMGSKYRLPSYDRLSFGILGTVRFGKQFIYDARAGVQITPVNMLGLAISGGMNSYGPNLGVMLNLRLPLLSVFAGADLAFTKFTPQFVPIHPVNTSVNAGVVFTIGNAKVKKILESSNKN